MIRTGPAASVIIPTYNRCASLARALSSLAGLQEPRERYEVIVVDNNSNDATPQVVTDSTRQGLAVRYVQEPRLSFTVARHAGAEAAHGEFLLYIDDDVTVENAWLTAVLRVFESDRQAGVVGGPIKPVFEVTPPDWVINTPGLFNGLSLWDRGSRRHQTTGVPGPNLAVRKAQLEEVGGFPADTIGVEAEGRPGTIEKMYVGDGDYGLCRKIRRAGYKVIYEPEAAVYHHVPAVRLTKAWWRSRLAGEAHAHAFMDWREHSHALPWLLLRLLWQAWLRAGKLGFRVARNALQRKHWVELLDFQWAYVRSRVHVQYALLRHPALADHLWDIALTGVPPEDAASLLAMLP